MAIRLITVSDRMLKVTGMAHDEASAAAGFKAYCQAWRADHPDDDEPDFVRVRLEIWDDEIGPVVAPEHLVDGLGPTQRPALSSPANVGPSVYSSTERVNAAPALADALLEAELVGVEHQQVVDPALAVLGLGGVRLGGVELLGQTSLHHVGQPGRPDAAVARSTASTGTASPTASRTTSASRSALPASLEEIQASRAAMQCRQATVQTRVEILGLKLPERGVTFAQVERVAHALGCAASLLPTGEVRISGVFGIGVYASLAAAAGALNLRAFHPGALGDA